MVSRKVAVARNHHNLFIITVRLQQGAAEPEKRQVGAAVIFKNDALFNMFEKPGDCGAYSLFAAEVSFAKQGFYITGPVNSFKNFLSCSFDEFCFSGFVTARAICSDKKL